MSTVSQIAALEVRFKEVANGHTIIEEIRDLVVLRNEARALIQKVERQKEQASAPQAA